MQLVYLLETSSSHWLEKWMKNLKLAKKLFKIMIMRIEILEKYCGAGSSFFDSTIVIEELSKVDASLPKDQMLQCFCSSDPHPKTRGSKRVASYDYLQWITDCCDDDEPWNTMDEDTITFLRKILTNDVQARATIQQIKEESWLAVEEESTPSLKRKAIETESSSNDQQVESMAKRQRLEMSSE
ncbi:hypothetical protein CAEBREN_20084 [Caenorhabditis brenneri]|uniref:Acyl-CoA dehydrogenase/oxidase N-terminal domain-containing protein n=1 Tax=Caenorhabditis brenneri TaxID=135651 RepID=G0NWK3_CAEBE|nr:hypothetical protein CAEBREN_20084 [Caenorhabditis brenneri]